MAKQREKVIDENARLWQAGTISVSEYDARIRQRERLRDQRSDREQVFDRSASHRSAPRR